jgi:polyhydroxybutyrate depolymerase
MAHQTWNRPRTIGVLIVTIALLASLAVFLTSSSPAKHPQLAPKSFSYSFDISYGHRARSYLLHVPPAAARGKPLPLVLNLAGATQNGVLEELQSGMDNSADQDGYLVAYPNGTRISTVLTPDPVAKQAQYGWNAGQCCGLPVTKKVDDVGFLLKVISDIAARTPVDLRRV